MLTSALPPATTFGTWLEALELTSVDDDTYVDISAASEITVSLISATVGTDVTEDLTLRLSSGEVTLPSTGIIQWRAERTRMAALSAITYKVRITIDINGDRMVLMLGTLDILE